MAAGRPSAGTVIAAQTKYLRSAILPTRSMLHAPQGLSPAQLAMLGAGRGSLTVQVRYPLPDLRTLVALQRALRGAGG